MDLFKLEKNERKVNGDQKAGICIIVLKIICLTIKTKTVLLFILKVWRAVDRIVIRKQIIDNHQQCPES